MMISADRDAKSNPNRQTNQTSQHNTQDTQPTSASPPVTSEEIQGREQAADRLTGLFTATAGATAPSSERAGSAGGSPTPLGPPPGSPSTPPIIGAAVAIETRAIPPPTTEFHQNEKSDESDDDWLKELKPSGVTLRPHNVQIVAQPKSTGLEVVSDSSRDFYGEELDAGDEEWLTKELKARDHYAITCASCFSLLGYSRIGSSAKTTAPRSSRLPTTWCLTVPLGIAFVDPVTAAAVTAKKTRGLDIKRSDYDLVACSECRAVLGKRATTEPGESVQKAGEADISGLGTASTVRVDGDKVIAEFRSAKPPSAKDFE